MSTEPVYFNALNLLPQIGATRFRRLLNFFPSAEAAWRASGRAWEEAGLEQVVIQQFLETRTRIDPFEEFTKLERQKIRLLTYNEPLYPKLLKEIANPPALLYVRGEILPQDELAVAVVGSRKSTPYGQQVVEELVRDLASAQITVVSGLALGIDAFAHKSAIEAGGRTMAVLACGLDEIYPANNRLLGEKILAGSGAIISEFPLGTPPLKHHFPYRNRIISGLSLGTVVIEAAVDSGALITARHALEQNRQVYAVPGSIYNSASAGPNNLLKMGAKPVTTAQDILEDLNLGTLPQQIATAELVGDNEEEQKILGCLTRNPQHFDLITKQVGLPAATVAATLTIMEMKGKIRNVGGNQYVRAR